jgi:thiamine kinase-like enzyme
MSEMQTPNEVLRELPEWRDATSTELAGGLTNRSWLLQQGDRRAVLKVDDRPRQAPYNTRLAEAAVQSAAAQAGLANNVLFADHQVYLTEYIEGAVWDPACLDQEAKIEQLASALRRLHSLPRSGRTFDAVAAAKRYVKNIDNPDEKVVAVCLDVIENLRLPNYLCCCHNDLVAENIITTPALKFLDWEYACDNDPLFDLATIIEHHELGEGPARTLLDTYFNGSGERWHAKLAEQQRLYLALFWLWLASRPDSSDRALKRLAARLTTSYS